MDGSIPRMNRRARRRFVAIGRRSRDRGAHLRFLVIAHLGAGRSMAEAARSTMVAPATVSRVARRFREGGQLALFDARAGNGPRKVDPAFLRDLARVLRGTPEDHGFARPTWTRELLREVMVERGHPRVAACTIGRALHRLGARLGRPKPVVLCPWPRRKRLARVAELRRLAENCSEAEPVYFSDEVDVHLNPKIGQDWMLPGKQRLVVTPGQNKKRYLAGALHAGTRTVVWVAGDRKASWLFCQLLWRLVAAHPEAKRIHLILDNYIIHKSKVTQQVLASLGDRVQLHFLPPYCPQENRIERVWQDLHASVTRNHRCRSITELMARVEDFLHAYNRRHESNFKPSLLRAAA